MFTNGFNYFHFNKTYLADPHAPIQVKGIYLFSRFLENYNLNIILIIVPWLLSCIFLCLAKTAFKSNESWRNKLIRAAKICVL